MVISCYRDSYALTYAINNSIKYVIIGEDKKIKLQKAIDEANKVKDSNSIYILLRAIENLSKAMIEFNEE